MPRIPAGTLQERLQLQTLPCKGAFEDEALAARTPLCPDLGLGVFAKRTASTQQ